jgi:hypothetical protein
MSERLDEIAKAVAARTPRRRALLGVGAVALGALGIRGVDLGTAAQSNECQQCKRQCKRNNKKRGKKDPNNCSRKCRDRCNNT